MKILWIPGVQAALKEAHDSLAGTKNQFPAANRTTVFLPYLYFAEHILTILISVVTTVVVLVVTHVTNRILEDHKAKLELTSKEQAKRRELYDELSSQIELTFGTGQVHSSEELSLAMNKLFGKLALYAPDDVYIAVRDALIVEKVVIGREVKPLVYHALRKSLFGSATKLNRDDLVPHIGASHIPEDKLKVLKQTA